MSGKEIQVVAFDLGNVIAAVDETLPARRFAELSGRPQAEVFDAVFSPERKALFESGEITWEEHARQAIATLGLEMAEPEFRAVFKLALTAIPDVVEIVARVAARLRIAIASNTSAPHWEWAQEQLPFASRFDPQILSYQVGAMKPSAAFYDALIERSGVDASRIFFTDDLPANIEGARQAGIAALLFTGAPQLREDLASAGIRI